MKYNHAILGGTFDKFHIGHKHFLDGAVNSADQLTIGITTERMFSHKPLASSIESYETRKQNVEKYLKDRGFDGKFNIIPLNDIFGTSLSDRSVEAIVTTHHSIKNVEKVNGERAKLGLNPLSIVFVEPLHDSSGKIISSSRIRAHAIDREGNPTK